MEGQVHDNLSALPYFRQKKAHLLWDKGNQSDYNFKSIKIWLHRSLCQFLSLKFYTLSIPCIPADMAYQIHEKVTYNNYILLVGFKFIYSYMKLIWWWCSTLLPKRVCLELWTLELVWCIKGMHFFMSNPFQSPQIEIH